MPSRMPSRNITPPPNTSTHTLILALCSGALLWPAAGAALRALRRRLCSWAAALHPSGQSERGCIKASGAHDPGSVDVFGTVSTDTAKLGSEEMNTPLVPNPRGGPELYAFSSNIKDLGASPSGTKTPRRFVCLVLDLQNEYEAYLQHTVSGANAVLAAFRKRGQPVVWTNWSRVFAESHLYSAVDRYYGPRGIANKTNPVYIWSDGGNITLPPLAPIDDSERSRVIESNHLSKFADLDGSGREILYPMLKAWGVDTIVLLGSWTDDCIAATAFDAVDRYGFDVLLVTDAVATATPHGEKMVECIGAAICTPVTSADVASYLDAAPSDMVLPPTAPLHGSVYLSYDRHVCTRSRHS